MCRGVGAFGTDVTEKFCRSRWRFGSEFWRRGFLKKKEKKKFKKFSNPVSGEYSLRDSAIKHQERSEAMQLSNNSSINQFNQMSNQMFSGKTKYHRFLPLRSFFLFERGCYLKGPKQHLIVFISCTFLLLIHQVFILCFKKMNSQFWLILYYFFLFQYDNITFW